MGRVVSDPGTVRELGEAFYGEETPDGLRLSGVEEAYLVEKGKLDGTLEEILASGRDQLEVEYLVYRDLRSRGFHLSHGGAAADFLVYPRGKGPGEAPAKLLVHAVSEREGIRLAEARRGVREAEALRRRAVYSVVDEEGDVTHYALSAPRMSGEHVEAEFSCDGTMLGDRVVTDEKRLHEEEFYGQPLGDLVQLSLVEAHHLLESGRLELDVPRREFLEQARALEEEFDDKSRLYGKLRSSGLVPKTGFKFGSHFRTYSYFESLDDFPHAEHLVHGLEPDHVFDPPELSGSVRLAHSVRKKMVFASMGEGLEFVGFDRVRP
ncbi:MAG: tRNA-splicing endonuclease [Methanonatronarchaeales archaeon]|nr:tRNA-splicing endonuclease [Methanonatronarchaeales archaeon]